MAPKLLNLATILSLLIFLSLHSQIISSTNFEDLDDDEEYVLDNPFANAARLRSRFLISVKKGTHCDPDNNTVCNRVSANNGTIILDCCKKHCRNVLGDRNNCGGCGNKCGFGMLCCNGICTSVAYNPAHCGKCNNVCSQGLQCVYGTCGYA